MLGFFTKAVATMAAVHATLGLASPITSDVDIEKRGSGFVNAVYFTNW